MAEIICTTISLQGNINLLCARVCAKRDYLPCPAIHGRSYLVLIVLAISAGVYSGCFIAGFLGLQSSLGGQIMNSAPFLIAFHPWMHLQRLMLHLHIHITIRLPIFDAIGREVVGVLSYDSMAAISAASWPSLR